MVKYGLLLVAFVVGCSGQDPVSSETPAPAAKLTVSGTKAGGSKETRIRLAPERPRLIFDTPLNVGGLEITWLEVQDSRCPEGADCIWEGEVAAQIQVREDGEDLGIFDLKLSSTEKALASVRAGAHVVRLLADEPWPELGVETPRGDYAALLAVGRRGAGMTVSDRPAGSYRGPLPPGRPVEPRPEPKPEPGPDHAALALTLTENRVRWDESGSASYQFNFQRSCFCLRDYTREAVVQVEEGAIVAATYADDDTAVDADLNDRYDTIDELFALLEEAIATGAVQIDVEFDAALGYPTRLYIDRDRRIADEEQWIEASAVVLSP